MERPIPATSPRPLIILLLCAAIAFVVLLALDPPHAHGITGQEAGWLASAPKLAGAIVDGWIGLAARDSLLRIPAIALAWVSLFAAFLVLSRAPCAPWRRWTWPLDAKVCPAVSETGGPEPGARGEGWRQAIALGAGVVIAVGAGAQVAFVAGPYLVGSVVPAALLTGALTLWLIASSVDWRPRTVALLLVAQLVALAEPGLLAFPLGAALGVAASEKLARPAASRGFVLLAAALMTLLLVLRPPLPWSGEMQGRGVVWLERIVLAGGVSVLAAAAWGRSRRDAPVLPALGALGASFLWLLVPELRSISIAPLPVLLATIVPLAALVAFSVEWSPGRAAAAAAVPALAMLAWCLAAPLPQRALPVGEAIDGALAANPGIRVLLVGTGLTRGVLERDAHPRGLLVDRAPDEGPVGVIGLAAAVPTLAERDAALRRIGDRVLARYGIVENGGPTVKWAVLAPYRLTVREGGSRPNIVILSVDTLRADHLSFYGYARRTSPRLERWASGALVFDQAMAPAPSTAPSFAGLMTGRLPLAHGVRKNYEFLDPANLTLASILERAGYETAAFVSSYVLTAENCGLDLGFETYDQRLDAPELNRSDRPVRLAPALREAVLGWLESRPTEGRPWFLWVHAIDPHGPYTPLPEFAGAFSGPPEGATVPPPALRYPRQVPREAIPPYQWLGTTDFARYLDAYDDEILQTDDALGALVEAIEARPSPRGTIVVFVADHGEAFGEHGVYFDHGRSLHVEEIHVPLAIKDSARAGTGRRVGGLVSTLDILPTLLARLGVDLDAPLDGRALGDALPAAANAPNAEAAAAPALGNWMPGETMAARLPFKVIVRAGGGEAAALSVYDIEKDPGELRPLDPATRGPAAADLERAALLLASRDPLTKKLGRALGREQWERLDEAGRENLRSLGYAAP